MSAPGWRDTLPPKPDASGGRGWRVTVDGKPVGPLWASEDEARRAANQLEMCGMRGNISWAVAR